MRRSDVVVLGVIGAVAQLAGFVVRAWGLYVVSVASELRRRVNGADIQGIIEAVPVGRVPATLAWAEHERPSFPRQLTRPLEPITAPPRGHITVGLLSHCVTSVNVNLGHRTFRTASSRNGSRGTTNSPCAYNPIARKIHASASSSFATFPP